MASTASVNSSPLGHNAAERSLPLRDAFAVLFFVSVGMLFDPTILVRVLGRPPGAALTVAASLAQIGEFSFILAALSLKLGGISQETHDLILAAALLSISLNPFVFAFIDRIGGRPSPPASGSVEGIALAGEEAAAPNPATA
jgi:CPA2 family monovalent cation:H+ antiporter-2